MTVADRSPRAWPGWAGSGAFVLSCCTLAPPLAAQEIAPFRLTGVEGHVGMRYVGDAVTTQSAGGSEARSRVAQSAFVNEVFVMTHSYVYHPKFLTLDIGGGPILDRQSYTTDAGQSTSQSALYNFTGRATLFKDMPVRGSVFYDHLNPTVTLAPGLVMTQETSRYGFDVGASGPKVPFPARVAYTHSATLGQGGERSVNDTVDQTSFSIGRNFGSLGSTQFQYQAVQQVSRSGSVNLPIQEASAGSTGMNLDTRLNFGADRQYDLTHLMSANTRSYTVGGVQMPVQKDANFLLNLNARHTAQFTSFAVYQQSSSQQGPIDSAIHTLVGGVTYNPLPSLGMSLTGRQEQQDNTQFTMRNRGLEGSLRYEQPMPLGVLQVGYSLKLEQRAQDALQPQVQVLDERLPLSGLSYTLLAFPRIIRSSIAVFNATRSQRYDEGVDYELLLIGFETRIRRLPGGRILDGEEVVVDYQYDTGGTYSLNQQDQSLSLNWGLSRYASTYYRRFDSTPRLTSGEPTFALNTVRSDIYGVRADLPLQWGIALSVGGNSEFETRQESIAPYRRRTDDLYVQTDESLFGLGNFRVGTRRARVDYSGLGQDMDSRGVDVRYWARPWFGVDLSLGTSQETSVTGGVMQRRSSETLNAQWRERKLTVTATLSHVRESQGSYERDRMLLQMLLRREF